MRTSRFFLATLKEVPAEATTASHKLMLRSGMIRKLASGLYSWLPLGVRVLQKVEAVVREEMNKAGALELLMPMVQPADLWQESGRWDQYGFELLKFADRHERGFCLGPTHEEVITDMMRGELASYKQLPLNVYQIQTKFRDEIRPRFGVMRSREFIMKDAYSFHVNAESLQESYDLMYKTYATIFTRLGLDFRAVLADTGAIGGDHSHEFQVLADSGEDIVVYSDGSDYAANIERASALIPDVQFPEAVEALEKLATPGVKAIDDVVNALSISKEQSVKTLLVKGADADVVALVLRGDHDLNEIKAAHLPQVHSPLTFVDEDDIQQTVGAGVGSIGPVKLSVPCLVDHSAAALATFVCGANEDGYHFKGANWQRDVDAMVAVDIRNVVEGDASPDGNGSLQFKRGIEVGQVFQLGDKYAKAMKLSVLNEQGKAQSPLMGCYGIGVTRTVAAAIEQNHDDKGITWPQALAPFSVVIVPIQMHKSYRVAEAANQLYQTMLNAGIDVLLDDRKERPGVMFSDMDLIGIPHRIVIGEKGLDKGTVEYKSRLSADMHEWPVDDAVGCLQQELSN